MLLCRNEMKLSDLVEFYNNILKLHGDMELVLLKKEYVDDDGWFINDQYEKVDEVLVGYTKDVYLYNDEYYNDLPHDFQKYDKRKVFVIDEI